MDGGAANDSGRGCQPHRFTVADYRRMVDAGILGEDSRVELIRGLIVDKAPITPSHAGMVNLLNGLLSPLLAYRAVLSVQNPVQLDEHSEVEPDIAVLRFRTDYYRSAIPCAGDVLVAIEVADTTLQKDRDMKVPLYAGSGIPECWLVNLVGGAVEVHREPVRGLYSRHHSICSEGVLDIAALPGLSLMWEDLWIS
jgi:Uma2 family endonuclease